MQQLCCYLKVRIKLVFTQVAIMSKKKDIVNEIKGSIGDFVIYQRYGKTFLRSRPKTMNHPNSDAQLEQRHKFSMSNTLAKNYRAAVGHVSVETDVPKSPYNSLLGLIRRTGFKGKYPDISWNWELIDFSEGSLALPQEFTFTETDSKILLQWNKLETKEKGTFFLIGVNIETLQVCVSSDSDNSGLLSLEKSKGLKYFAFKEWIDEERTLKSKTLRYLTSSDSTQISSDTENPSVIGKNKNVDFKTQIQLEDELESVNGLEDELVDISFNPAEFGAFSKVKELKETKEVVSSDQVTVETLGTIDHDIVYSEDEFTDFVKIDNVELVVKLEEETQETVNIGSILLEESEEQDSDWIESDNVDSSFNPAAFSDVLADIKNEQVQKTDVEKATSDEIVVETSGIIDHDIEYNAEAFFDFTKISTLDPIENKESENTNENTSETKIDSSEDNDNANLDSEIPFNEVDENVTELADLLEDTDGIQEIEPTFESDKSIINEYSREELVVEKKDVNSEITVVLAIKDVVVTETVEPESNKEIKEKESKPSKKAEKEKTAKKTLVEKAITSKEDEMRNQLSLF